LSPKRPRRDVENDGYGEFILRAYGRRVADGDIDALSFMTRLADELDDAIAQAVKDLRTQGYSWTEIGDRLGITRQAAQAAQDTTDLHAASMAAQLACN
jgi:hypothetical protein